MNNLQKTNSDDHKPVFYILFNTFRITINEFRQAIPGFLDCEIEKVNEKNIVVWHFNIISIVFILAIGCIIIALSGKNSANIEKSWTKLKKSVNKSQKTVKNAIFQRLNTFKSIAEKDKYDQIFEKNSKKIELKRKYQDIIRIFILVLFSIGAMLIVSEVLYKQSQKKIIFNNEVFNNLMMQSTKIWQLGFFTLEALASRDPHELSEYANFTIHPYYMDSINETLLEIRSLQNVIEEYSVEGKISIELADLLYFNATKHKGVETLGIFIRVDDLIDDSKNYIHELSDLNVEDIQDFAYSVENTALALRNVSFYGSDVMKDEVLYTNLILGIFFTLMVLLLIILSIFINFRHLNYEGKILESTENLKNIFESAQTI